MAASIKASEDMREVIMISGNPYGRKVVSCRGTSETEKTREARKGCPCKTCGVLSAQQSGSTGGFLASGENEGLTFRKAHLNNTVAMDWREPELEA